jgi:hypothetical protein
MQLILDPVKIQEAMKHLLVTIDIYIGCTIWMSRRITSEYTLMLHLNHLVKVHQG